MKEEEMLAVAQKINFMEDNFGIRSFVCVESYVNLMDS